MWLHHRLVWQEVKGNIGSIPALSGANIDCDDAFVVCIEQELEGILVWIIGRHLLQLDGLFPDVGLVLDRVDLLLVS